jgi:predicted amidohydrolase
LETEHNLTPGDDFYVADLNIGNDVIKIGSMICYDREFPESARILMLKGAEIIIVPNACPMEINRLSQLRTRAFENMVGLATVNYAKGQPDCNGHSTAFDGIAWGEDSSRDMLIIEAGESEGIYLAPFPIDKLREYREKESFGNAYRKPSKYGILISDKVEKPFIRNDARR